MKRNLTTAHDNAVFLTDQHPTEQGLKHADSTGVIATSAGLTDQHPTEQGLKL